MTNLDLQKELYPDIAYAHIEDCHKLWSEMSAKIFESFHEIANDGLLTEEDFLDFDEASKLEWKAYEWALDNQQFIQQYQKDHPEITYRFFEDG
jgi:hypothetical protein